MRVLITILFTTLLGTAAAAQEIDDDLALFDIGSDVFRAGSSVLYEGEGADDLFLAGETVRGRSDIGGTAHLAGRRVTMSGATGGDAYAAGMEVAMEGAVAGDATLAGYEVSVGEVGGDLRVSGSELTVGGPVAGYALVAGDEVTLNGAVAGDASIAARRLEFGPDARVDGTLTLYEAEPGALEVPERVAAPGQIVRRQLEEWEGDVGDMRPFNLGRAIASFLFGVIVVAGLAALIASLVPEQLAAMRRRILDRPFGTLWLGFLTLSAVVGSAVLFALTLIGIIVSPAAILLAVVTGFAGYVIGVYAFGVGLMMAFGRSEPDSTGDRALAAGIGALVAGVLALIPFLGWLFVLAVTLAGVGAVAIRMFQPRFYAGEY